MSSLSPRIHIGGVIRNAVIFNLKNWRGDPVALESLARSTVRLFVLLQQREIKYLVVGGIALLGLVKVRNTEDIDLIMSETSLKKLPEITINEQNDNYARGVFEDLRIDIRLTSNPIFEIIKRQYAGGTQFMERGVPSTTVEGLVLLKLYELPSLYRQGNFARVGIYENDIATLIQRFNPALDPLFEELSKHLSETDLAFVHEVVADIQKRIARFSKGFDSKPK